MCIVIIAVYVFNVGALNDAVNTTSVPINDPYPILFWNAPPYVYKDRLDGVIKGSLVHIFHKLQSVCSLRPLKFYMIADDYRGYLEYFTTNASAIETDRGSFAYGGTSIMPYLSMDPDLTQWRNKLTPWAIGTSNIVVIAPLNRMKFFNKVWSGVKRCKIMIAFITVSAILIGIMVAFTERMSGRHDSNITSMADGIWWAMVTMTTVGYGDHTPRSLAGRFLAILWMIAGIFFITMVMATVLDGVSGISDAQIEGKNVGALKMSPEGDKLERDYRVKLTGYHSYRDILESVRNGEVEAGVMHTDIAAFLLNTNEEVEHPQRVVAVMNIDMKLPVGVWYATSTDRYWVRNDDELKCYNNNAPSLEKAEYEKNKRKVEIVTLFIEDSFLDFLRNHNVMQALLALCVVTIAIGLVSKALMRYCGDELYTFSNRFNCKRKFRTNSYEEGMNYEDENMNVTIRMNSAGVSTDPSFTELTNDVAKMKHQMDNLATWETRLQKLQSTLEEFREEFINSNGIKVNVNGHGKKDMNGQVVK